MKKIFSFLTAILFAGSMWATTVSWTASSGKLGSSAPSSGTITDTESNVWNYTRTLVSGASYTGWTNNYIQLGKNGGVENITFTTSAIDGVIESVAVDCGSYQGKHSVSITVGGDTYLATTAVPTWSNSGGVKSGTGSSSGTITISFTGGTRAMYVKSITVVYSSETPSVAKPAISGETPFYDETEVTISCATDGAAIYYTTDGNDPSSSSTAYTAPFKLNATSTVKAIAIKGEDESGIAEKAFTKAPAFESIEALVAAGLSTGTPVKVSFNEVGITGIYTTKAGDRRGIYLDVKAGEKDVEIYYNGGDVPNEWVIGGVVSGTINATWTLYSGQWEIVPATTGWKWTDLTYEVPVVPAIIITSTSINIPAAGQSDKIDVVYNNIDDLSSAKINFYEADGTTPATYDWLTASFDGEKDVTYTVAANEATEAREAYLKVQVGEVYSELVSITQAAYVPDYATLPFAFDGGRSAIESTNGLTQNGLSSDYASSPKLKFDGTGDYVILKINEAPGTLTFDIKGNGFADGTFTVQTSVDGETYTDLETYTELGATQSESFSEINSSVRYIKWIYTEKSSGNVALGNIALAKSSTTALDNTEASVKAVKVLREGQIFILRGEKVYTVQGQLVK